jgi:hypothetical protein
MKVKELVKYLEDYKDFEVEASIFEKDNSEWGAGVRTFKIYAGDIGYSDKVVNLDLVEEK